MRTFSPEPPWSALYVLAARQRGILTRADLEAHGVHHRVARRRVLDGRLCERHPGVFSFGHGPLPDASAVYAALRWGGQGAVVSHLSAAALFGWVPHPEAVHLTATGGRRTTAGVELHETRRLPANHVQLWVDLRVTIRSRTLVDLADVLGYDELRRAADTLPRLPVAHLELTLAELPGRHGAGRVARLIRSEEAHTKSELERRYLAYCRVHRLPPPTELNHRVGPHKADCVYEEERLVLELDGRAHHERRAQTKLDHRRDMDYQLAGYRFGRFDWEDLDPANPAAAARIRALLALGAAGEFSR